LTEDDEKRANEHRSGFGGDTGKSVSPSSGSAEEPHVEGEGPVQEVPIGIPMPSEEFMRLKAQAERPSREEGSQEEADEDASTTQED
jgi:hypothetical protein